MTETISIEDAMRIDPAHMRQVLGHVPTSVAVVCTLDAEGVPVGCTIGSFVSVSLEPTLVAFFCMDSSATLQVAKAAGSFAINILSEDQDRVCDLFARKRPDRFNHVGWTPGRNGNPRLHGSLAVVDCELESVTTIGDHEMILGRVVDLCVERLGRGPLVFARGALRELAPVKGTHASHPFAWLGD